MIRAVASTVAFLVTLALTGMAGSSAESAQLAVIRGRVVSEDDGAALRGARVTLIGGSATSDGVFTDTEGRFALGVPVSYRLRVTKTGYAPVIVGGKNTPASDVLEVRLPRGAVLSGRVTDALAFPVIGAYVRARREAPSGDGIGPIEVTAETNDTGEFRIGSLPAGRYTVRTEQRPPMLDSVVGLDEADERLKLMLARRAAVVPPTPLSEEVSVDVGPGAVVGLSISHRERAVIPPDAPIGGAVTGFITDEYGDPKDAVTVRLWRLRHADDRQVTEVTRYAVRADDRGQYRQFHVVPGRYLVVATADEPNNVPVYHPGGASLANALPIVVGRRQEIPGVHIALSHIRGSRVTGVVRTTAGQPRNATVSLMSSHRSAAIARPPVVTTADANGFFQFLNVPPGEYVLRAASNRRIELPGGGLIVPSIADTIREIGVRTVTVAGDVAPVTVVMSPAATISGQIVLETSRGVAPSQFRIGTIVHSDYAARSPANAPLSVVQQDGRFVMYALMGPTRFVLSGAPRGYRLKSVDVSGVNAADTPLDFRGAEDSRTDVTIVISDDVATVSGRVTDEGGGELGDYRVVAFPVLRERWFAGSLYLKLAAGPNVDGEYVVPDLPPGEYWIAAVDVIDGDAVGGEWQNAEFLTGLARQAQRIDLGPRGNVRTDLRMVRRPR